jgi:hypothetical protein
MQMSNEWYQLLSQLGDIAKAELRAKRTANWSHYGRCISTMLNNAHGVTNFTPWRVVGISEEALQHFRACNFDPSGKKGIERGHIIDRYKLAEALLSRNPILTNSALCDAIAYYDVTVLMTKHENKQISNTQLSYVPFVNPNGSLYTSTFISYKYRKSCERQHLQQIHDDYVNGKIKLTNTISIINKFHAGYKLY